MGYYLQTPLQTPFQTPLPGAAQTPLPGTTQTPLPGTADNSMYNFPADGTPNDYSSAHDSGGVSEMKDGMPSPYMVILRNICQQWMLFVQ